MRPLRPSRVALLEGVIVKPLHSTAYLLVGWYLMAPPPLSHDGRMHPLSDWAVRGTFRTEKDCDAKLAKLPKTEPSLSYLDSMPPEEIYGTQCVASNDSRLGAGIWHLMMPHRPGDAGEPLSQWYKAEPPFNTEAECNDVIESDRGLYLGKHPRDRVVQEQISRLRYSQCVADNDPRFQPK
jgi:hypothetical protein